MTEPEAPTAPMNTPTFKPGYLRESCQEPSLTWCMGSGLHSPMQMSTRNKASPSWIVREEKQLNWAWRWGKREDETMSDKMFILWYKIWLVSFPPLPIGTLSWAQTRWWQAKLRPKGKQYSVNIISTSSAPLGSWDRSSDQSLDGNLACYLLHARLSL